jgi:hypothetical protein
MKRYSRRPVSLERGYDIERWRSLANIALRYLDGEMKRENLLYYANRTRTVLPPGQPGHGNVFTLLYEAVELHLNPRHVLPRPGVDYQAMTADNRDEIRRLALMALDRIQSIEAVDRAARQCGL